MTKRYSLWGRQIERWIKYLVWDRVARTGTIKGSALWLIDGTNIQKYQRYFIRTLGWKIVFQVGSSPTKVTEIQSQFDIKDLAKTQKSKQDCNCISVTYMKSTNCPIQGTSGTEV